MLQKKAYQNIFWVGICTGDPIIALKHGKKSDFHDMSPLRKQKVKRQRHLQCYKGFLLKVSMFSIFYFYKVSMFSQKNIKH